MSEFDSITIQIDNGDVLYYQEVKKHIDSLSEKFREKSVIKQGVYDNVIKYLFISKGQASGSEAHATVSHGGRDKTIHELNSHYSWIPRFSVEIFIKQYVPCQTRKLLKQHVITKLIISLEVMTRLQIDLIDMRTKSDALNPDIIYNWTLNCIDHFSKFTWAYPLKNKNASDVALKLRELFFVFGPPKILHSDSGREFVANGSLPVVYGINTRLSGVTKTTPYQVMFGQPPRSDSNFWKLVKENEVIDEESLPTPVNDFNDDITEDKRDDFHDYADIIDKDVIQLVQQLSDDAAASAIS
ncbi:unnamed protein product [Rotaria sp. Silwood2]|nr:unnamed protein product [Rotaria sp. Silwood2]CAF2797537.1 unnamed protein product [Rotaria sp. Silwood2]CAF4018149.1 unnamed protein product [Rotaria sp. Silwood2]CAF4159998.1 unnamed protein product [Rotaria sp. Silwood2]